MQQFNEDQYSYIIASDACELQDEIEPVDEQAKKETNEDEDEVPAKVMRTFPIQHKLSYCRSKKQSAQPM